MNDHTRFLIVGPNGAGKNTFAKLLAEALGLRADHPAVLRDCGTELIKRLARIQVADASPDVLEREASAMAQELARTKDSWRYELRALGDVLREIDDGAVLKLCGDARIVVGARTKAEMPAWLALDKGAGRLPVIVWISRADGPQDGIEFGWDWLMMAYGDLRRVKLYRVQNDCEPKLRDAAAALVQVLNGK